MKAQIRVAAAVLVVAGALTLTVLGAAGGGDWTLEERDFSIGEPEPVDPEAFELPSEVFEPPELAPPGEPRDLSWVRTVGIWVAVGLALVIAWRIWVWARRRLEDLAPRRPVRAASDVPTDDPEPEVPVLRRGVVEAQRSLRDIARHADAVVAAWVALETAAEASGVARRAAQTPTEFTLAVLHRTSADPAAVKELLALYHLARFSGHPIGDAEVAAAARCLGALAAAFDPDPGDPEAAAASSAADVASSERA